MKELDYGKFQSFLDLHTHYTGQVRPYGMMSAMEECDTPIQIDLLKNIGIDLKGLKKVSVNGVEYTNLKSLKAENDQVTDLIVEKLSLAKSNAVVSFEDLERVYSYRRAFLQDIETFRPILWDIAQEYKAEGVLYAEISFGKMSSKNWLSAAQHYTDEIEKQTGVNIKFFQSIWKQNPTEYNNYLIQKFKENIFQYDCLVGVDFSGEENSSIDLISPLLHDLEGFKETSGRKFEIKVHAGETSYFPYNTRIAIEAGATRIGHGVYGVSDEVVKMAKEKDVTIELNLISNLKLIGQDELFQQAHMRKYFQKDVKCTFGSDGLGIFNAQMGDNIRIAESLGATEDDLYKIKKTDLEYYKEKTFYEGSKKIVKKRDKIDQVSDDLQNSILKIKKKMRDGPWI